MHILIFYEGVILRYKNYELADVNDYERLTKHCEPTQYLYFIIMYIILYFIIYIIFNYLRRVC